MTRYPRYVSGPPFQGSRDALGRNPPLSQTKVEIYTKWGCPYCVAANALLDRKGVASPAYDITMGGPRLTEMQERVPGARTVPPVLIDVKHSGGFDATKALDRPIGRAHV